MVWKRADGESVAKPGLNFGNFVALQQDVGPALSAPDANVSPQLRLEVPANADLSEPILKVKVEGRCQVALPVNVSVTKELSTKFTVMSKLQSLRGSPKSNFAFTLNIRSGSGSNRVCQLRRGGANFETLFTGPTAARSCP